MARVRAIAAFLAEHGQHERARAFERPHRVPVEICSCSSCKAFYRRHPFDGWQLLLFPRVEIEHPAPPPAGSGSRPDATPLPAPDRPADPPAGATTNARARRSPASPAGRKPETVHA